MLYGATTVMIPDYDILGTVKLLAGLGYTAVDWRVRYHVSKTPNETPSFWGRHLTDVTPDNLENKIPEIRKVCGDYGITSLALMPRASATEKDECLKLFAGAEALGCPMVRIGAACDPNAPYPEQIEQAVAAYQQCIEWANPHRVKVIQEIHTGTVAVSCEQAHLIAKELPPERFGVIWDINNMSHQGFALPYRYGIELLGKHLAHTHIGNRKWAVKGNRQDGTLEWGMEWAGLHDGVHHIFDAIGSLKRSGYAGALCLEDFRPGDTRQKLAEGLKWMKAAYESV